MSKLSETESTVLFNRICAALSFLLIVMQFLPFWTYAGESGNITASISSYIWLPYNHEALTASFTESIANYDIINIVTRSVLILVLGIVSILFCLMKSNSRYTSILPTLCGIIGVWAYLSNTALRMGSGWILHLVLSVLLLLVGAVTLLKGLTKKTA